MNKILELIKEYNTIIIHGHIRPDGDCIGSQFGLMHIINETFPEKKVYVTGNSSEYVSFLGKPELINDELFKDALSIIVDCPVSDRLSDTRYDKSKCSIKIDHHFDSEEYTDYEYIDYNATSTTQIITEFYLNFKNELKMNKLAATALYTGLLTDSGYFHNSNVTPKTFETAKILLEHGVDISYVNNNLNLETLSSIKLKSYCLNNFKTTDNGFAYMVLTKEQVDAFGVTDEVAASLITSISTIKECPVWALIIENDELIRIRLRSRGPAINELAKRYNGGGHKMASGGKLKNWRELDQFIIDSDNLVKEYKESLQ